MIFPHFFIKNIEAEDLLEKFFIAAVAAILGIRLFLKLTNYPQLSGRGLHIAHLFWGGLLMLAAIVFLLIFLDRKAKQTAAVIGGVGFGAFIDELGKFITSDNNYFYQPTVAIIYVFFILIYLGAYTFKKYSHFSSHEYLINSLDLLKEAVSNDLDKEEKRKAMFYLKKVKNRDEIFQSVKKLFQNLDVITAAKTDIFSFYTRRLSIFYHNLIQQKWFAKIINGFFLLQAAASFFTVAIFAFGTFAFLFYDSLPSWLNQLGWLDILSLGTSAFSGIFVIYGVLKIRYSRLLAYRQFKKAMLISIFLVQVFTFYKDQLSAFFGLLFDITILLALNYMIERERVELTKVQINGGR